MAELKTKPTKLEVETFLNGIPDETKRRDCNTVLKLMKKITKSEPRMWGSTIVGFGEYHYKYASGHEGDCFVAGFSPRKDALTLYIMPGFGKHAALMKKLGKHKTGKSCLYVKRLEDIDMKVLEQLIQDSVAAMAKTYKTKR